MAVSFLRATLVKMAGLFKELVDALYLVVLMGCGAPDASGGIDAFTLVYRIYGWTLTVGAWWGLVLKAYPFGIASPTRWVETRIAAVSQGRHPQVTVRVVREREVTGVRPWEPRR